MNIYDMNKQVIAQLPLLCEENIINSISLIYKDLLNILCMLYIIALTFSLVLQQNYDLKKKKQSKSEEKLCFL
jgi:hypothetical protein